MPIAGRVDAGGGSCCDASCERARGERSGRSVPAAAMDAARAEIERLRAALVDGERERAALKSARVQGVKGAEEDETGATNTTR